MRTKTKYDAKVLLIALVILFSLNPILGIIILLTVAKSASKNASGFSANILADVFHANASPLSPEAPRIETPGLSGSFFAPAAPARRIRLSQRTKYLHIALNSTLPEAKDIIDKLPSSDRILIEVGTPLIKIYGTDAIVRIKRMASADTYIIADNKCADLASREVPMMASAGANAATCLGVAPIETVRSFIDECEKAGIDSMLDMMNVESALAVLKKLKKLPDVVILHRGVDESEFSKEKQIPYYQIKQIKGNYDVMVAVAGGDDIQDVQSAIFNDADIVVVWKKFYAPSDQTAKLAKNFLKEIK